MLYLKVLTRPDTNPNMVTSSFKNRDGGIMPNPRLQSGSPQTEGWVTAARSTIYYTVYHSDWLIISHWITYTIHLLNCVQSLSTLPSFNGSAGNIMNIFVRTKWKINLCNQAVMWCVQHGHILLSLFPGISHSWWVCTSKKHPGKPCKETFFSPPELETITWPFLWHSGIWKTDIRNTKRNLQDITKWLC